MSRASRKFPPGIRQRRRANGTLRVWWEPSAKARELGMEPVELNADRLNWSIRRAEELNAKATFTITGKAPRSQKGRTMSALIANYMEDPLFTDELKPKTQAGYRSFLRIIDRKWGDVPVISMSKPVVRKWYLANCKARGDTMAARLNAMLSILFSFAEMEGWRAEGTNPCFRLRIKAGGRRNRAATWAEFDALVAAAEDLGHHALAWMIRLALYQGQRQTDLFNARPKDFREVPHPGNPEETVLAWKIDRSKRGTLGMMEIHPDIARGLRTMIEARAGKDHLLIDDTLGRPFDAALFRRRWDATMALASRRCPSLVRRDNRLQFRDLRRTFGVMARAGGAHNDDTADVLGNSAATDAALEDTYMPPSFATASRAVRAIRRPDDDSDERKEA